MRLIGRIFAFTLVILILAPSVDGGEVVIRLRTGSRLQGTIVKENAQEVELLLGDGMKMKIRKALILEIEEVKAGEKPDEPVVPTPAPEPLPAPGPVDRPKPEPGSARPSAGDPGFFAKAPGVAWSGRFSRYPTIDVARVVRFRAYEYVEHRPLAVSPQDPRYRRLVLEHGHGGSLSVWEFQYVGNLDLKFGDEVKFIAEITSPPEREASLIRLREGPTPVADRLSVILIRSKGQVRRYATPTVFDNRDFRQADFTEARREAMPIRTYGTGFEPLSKTWRTSEETEFLQEIRSPFGNSLRIKLERFRFRVAWLAADPKDRPDLDPELLRRNAIRPLALPGRPVATEELVRKTWGSDTRNRNEMNRLQDEFLRRFGTIGVRPGSVHYVEQDLLGRFGRKGVTLETRRILLSEELLEELTGG